MSLFSWILTVLAVLGTLMWLALHWRTLIALRRLPSLSQQPSAEPESWPKLSVIVAACDEQEAIEAAALTLLAQDYPTLEIVLVNDRSTDRTGEIIDRLAASDARVRVEHIEHLPDGWLGKVHALHRGTELATGDWLLFTDADVHLSPRCLRRAVSMAIERDLDLLPVLPRFKNTKLALETAISNFTAGFLGSLQAEKLSDPSSDAFVGIGAFNLVRAEALAQSPGFSWLRMEVADDLGLGYMLKLSGARIGLALGKDDVTVQWYPSIRSMVKGLEKNTFGLMGRYRVGRAMLSLAVMGLVTAGPALSFLAPTATYAWVLGLASIATLAALAHAYQRRMGQRFAAAFLHPLGGLVNFYSAVRSMVVILTRGGISWRGTFYPLPTLIEGQRLKL